MVGLMVLRGSGRAERSEVAEGDGRGWRAKGIAGAEDGGH